METEAKDSLPASLRSCCQPFSAVTGASLIEQSVGDGTPSKHVFASKLFNLSLVVRKPKSNYASFDQMLGHLEMCHEKQNKKWINCFHSMRLRRHVTERNEWSLIGSWMDTKEKPGGRNWGLGRVADFSWCSCGALCPPEQGGAQELLVP